MDILLKRAYEKPARGDGYRVLVDRLWPRGIKKDDLHLHVWAKELAPSSELRQWFAHDEKRWSEFQKRYRCELAGPKVRARIKEIIERANGAPAITLVYGARDRKHNEAVVLQTKFRRLL
ncbi:MAG: DUF488 domain-containing protein [Vulcanimicrobiaceae bacterium]